MFKKILFYYSFILLIVMVVGGFFTAKNTAQVWANFLLLPMLGYFLMQLKDSKND